MIYPSVKGLFSYIDYTSLNPYDSTSSIQAFIEKALEYHKSDYKVAALCVYPNFSAQVKEGLKNTGIKTAVVGACFPASQSFKEIKIKECELAIQNGAEEVDIVINLGAFFDLKYSLVQNEITAIKRTLGTRKLKVIIETGILKETHLIKKATELAILGGADFVKTSTGKVAVGATPKAVRAIAETIHTHLKTTDKRVGIKISGGVRTYDDAMNYYSIVNDVLGPKSLDASYFRIGASSLTEQLLNA